MTPDPNRHPHNEDGERVVVRDRRRIDPVTGEARTSGSQDPASQGSALQDSVQQDSVQPGAAPAGNASAAPAEPDGSRVTELTAEVAERTADLQRLSAEYANYRRRVDRDREVVLVNARAQFVGELLTVLDDIERAGNHGDLNGPFKSVADKLVSVVQKLGLEPFGTEGEPFDPSVHEAVQHESAEAAGRTVAVLSAVLRRGYRIGDRVLRPAMVTVTERVDDGTLGPVDEEPDVPAAQRTDPTDTA